MIDAVDRGEVINLDSVRKESEKISLALCDDDDDQSQVNVITDFQTAIRTHYIGLKGSRLQKAIFPLHVDGVIK